MKKYFYHILIQLFLVALFSSIANADFALQLGSFLDRANAEKSVKDLTEKSYRAFIHTQKSRVPGQGTWYKVRIGPFATLKDALSRKRSMHATGFNDDIVVVKTQSGKTDTIEGTIRQKYGSTKNKRLSRTEPVPTAPVQSKSGSHSKKATSPGKRDITLKWDPSDKADIDGYKIYYDTDPGPPYEPDEADYADEGAPPVIIGKDVTEITLHGLSKIKDYYLSITSFSTHKGIESPHSNEVAFPAAASVKEHSPKDKPAMPVGEEKPELLPFAPDETKTDKPVETPLASIDSNDATKKVDRASLISAGDVLEMKIPEQEDMSKHYDVDPSGNIYMMGVGKIEAKGLNLGTLTKEVWERIKKFLKKGDKVSIRLIERTRYIQIRGGVRYAGWYRVPQKITLDELVEMSGGLLSGSDYTGIRLKRKSAEGLREIGLKGKIAMEPDDILEVPYPKVYHSRIDAGDLLYVKIPRKQPATRAVGIESLQVADTIKKNQIEVDKNGYLYVPVYGHFYVKNMTTKEITKLVSDKLPRYLRQAKEVEINLIEKKHYVQVSGHVTNPGRYNIPEASNIQNAINRAGGAIDGAIMSDVSIKREWGGRLRSIRVNLYQFTVTGDPRLLTPLHEGDRIFVPISSAFGNVKRTLMPWTPPTERLEKDPKKKVRIFGAVNNPGIYEPFEGITLLDLLVQASGETDDADLSKILIIRNNKVEVRVNLEDFLQNEGLMKIPEIYGGDTVYVNYVELTVFEPKEDELFYVTGKVRSPGQYKLWDNMTILQAISLAGGLTEWADAEHITIVRNEAGKQENIPYNYRKGVSGKYPELNIYLRGRDVIVVP